MLVVDDLRVGADIKVNGAIYINEDGPEGDSYLYFYDRGLPDGRYLKWDNANTRFEVNEDLQCAGIVCTRNVHINFNNDAIDAVIYFGKSGSGNETLKWDKDNERFEFSDNLYVDGTIEFDSGSINHKDLAGLQGGQANEYYHLTDAEHGALVDGGSANGYHTHPASGSGNGNGVKTLEFSVAGVALADGTAGSAAPALSLLTTSDAADPQCRTFCLRFDDSTDEHVFWQFRLPTDYVSGGRLIVQFYNVDTQTDDDNTAYFDAILQAVTPGDATDMTALDLPNDGGGWAGTLKTLDAGSNGPRLYESSIDMTSNLDGMAAGDFIQFGLRRDVSEDDGEGDMAVITITFEYNY